MQLTVQRCDMEPVNQAACIRCCRILGLLLDRQPRLFRPLVDACIWVQSHWRGFKVQDCSCVQWGFALATSVTCIFFPIS